MITVYTLLSHTKQCLGPQLELFRRHLPGDLHFVVVQGPGNVRLTPAEEARHGVETLTLTHEEVPSATTPHTTLTAKAILTKLLHRTIPEQANRYALIVHGDLLPMRPFTMDELLAGNGFAARGDRTRRVLVWTLFAIDRQLCNSAEISVRGGMTDAAETGTVWESYREPPFEIVEPCWLHLDRMALVPGDIPAKLQLAATRLDFTYQPSVEEVYPEEPIRPFVPAPVSVSSPAPCVRLGSEVRRQGCPTCNNGMVMLKVFACSTHGECTPQTRLPGVACCLGCGDYMGAG